MSESNTVKLHRVFSAPPERVFKAFIDPDALVKWMAPHGFTAKVHHLDAKVGGTYKMSFSNFSTGSSHSFGGTYHEIIPNQLLRYSDQFDDPNLPGKIEVTIQLKAVSVGTELHITQSGIPDVIPVEACYLGWQESLQLLSLLVSPEIPDQ
ncbi:MAG: SRPBCC family protein [Acinetobacter sp.]